MTGSSERLEAEVLRLDRDHAWHPYAPMPTTTPPLAVADATGSTLRLLDGRTLVDGMSSWWCAIHGYRQPAIDQAIRRQLASISHVMFGGLTHEPGARLAARLAALAPGELQHVFFADSGSVAVEVAIKLCLQHQRGRGRRHRRKLLAFRGGYHGDTFGAMSLCDPVTGMHSMFGGTLAEQVFAARPPAGFNVSVPEAYLDDLRRLVESSADELAAVIVEPIVQGAGGMWFYSPEILMSLRELCDVHELLLVFDEIATGFGRTGELFAADHAGIAPDVMCVGKALTGGSMSLAATLCTPEVSAAVSASDSGALMHGPTFMANPLACAAALANLEVLDGWNWRSAVARIEARLRDRLAAAAEWPWVTDVRILGAIGVVELNDPVDLAVATAAAVAEGVWLRPFGRLVYTMPPFIATDDEVDQIAAGVLACAQTGKDPR